MFSFLLSLTVATITGPTSVVSYDLVRDYSGQTFFDGWDFFGSWDNLTLGTSLVFIFSVLELTIKSFGRRRMVVEQKRCVHAGAGTR